MQSGPQARSLGLHTVPPVSCVSPLLQLNILLAAPAGPQTKGPLSISYPSQSGLFSHGTDCAVLNTKISSSLPVREAAAHTTGYACHVTSGSLHLWCEEISSEDGLGVGGSLANTSFGHAVLLEAPRGS